jgi:hypothetical protein
MAGYIQRLRDSGDAHSELQRTLEKHLSDDPWSLLNRDEVSSLIADTNADGWSVDNDDVELVTEAESLDLSGDTVRFEFSFSCYGEQKENRAVTANSISGTTVATVDDDGLIEINNVEASIDEDDPATA